MEFYSHPDYAYTLEKAGTERRLIPIVHLCFAFPTDSDLALLSYAQADSFINYIQEEYGITGLQAMIYAYDQGVSCEKGVENALGVTLEQLESNWKRDVFSRDTILLYIYILSGILLILLISLGYFIFSRYRGRSMEQDWDENE